MSTGLPDIPIDAIAIDRRSAVAPLAGTSLYLGTDIGAYRSTDGGANWAVFNPNNTLPVVPVFDMAFQEQMGAAGRILRIATHGRGIWEIQTTAGGPTATPTPSPTATPSTTPGPTPGSAANISTRLPIGTGDNILITGFIITGPAGSTKRVIVRGIGPSTGIPGALADPTLELRDVDRTLLASNDNWRTTVIGGIITADQVAEIQASGAPPTNDAESALIATLAPGNYTALVRGVNNTTGIGLAEAFDLSLGSAARLANVSTRGFVQTGDNLMIGGFIIVNNPVRVVVRGIGPSLTAFGVPNVLADPTLELRGINNTLILANDNWRQTQQAEIMATGLQPTNDLESALVITLQPGNYTGLLRGTNNGTGNGVVEVFALPTLP
jgi:hypothetical protein